MAGAAQAPLERLTGFGRAQAGVSRVLRARDADQVAGWLATRAFGGASVALRGAGRSYGDAALNDGGAVIDLRALDRVLAFDPDSGLVDVEPGVTIEALWRRTLAAGWWPPVVPGTMRVTLGGAVAANVHGKNCFAAGPIGDHVRELELVLPTGERRVCAPDRDAELFEAAIGGFGWLGCIVRVRLQLARVHSGLLRVRALPARSLAGMFEIFEAQARDAHYLVGWLDAMSPACRGVVHRADPLAAGEDRDATLTLAPAAQALPARAFGVLPREWAWLGIRATQPALAMRAVNAAKALVHRFEGEKTYLQGHVPFHFLLDYFPEWERGYGRAGLIQVQPFVPRAAAPETFDRVLRLARARGLPPYLVVFKRHRADRFLLGHGLDGYSLAMDFPARRRAELWSLAREIQSLVVAAGGRFYFAKDSTLQPGDVARFLPADALRRFRELKRKCDPEAVLQTDLARRVWPELCEVSAR
jgi:FAD/FMN-containing dehydrogenase